MLLATINSSIILIALDIFRRIHLDPLTTANTNYLLRTTACLLIGCQCSGMTRELVSLLLVRGAGSWSVGVRSMELCPLRRHGGRSEFDACTAEVTAAPAG